MAQGSRTGSQILGIVGDPEAPGFSRDLRLQNLLLGSDAVDRHVGSADLHGLDLLFGHVGRDEISIEGHFRADREAGAIVAADGVRSRADGDTGEDVIHRDFDRLRLSVNLVGAGGGDAGLLHDEGIEHLVMACDGGRDREDNVSAVLEEGIHRSGIRGLLELDVRVAIDVLKDGHRRL